LSSKTPPGCVPVRRVLALAATLTLACFWPPPAAGQHPPVAGFYAEGDWITIGDFRHVTAVTAGDQEAYAGTTGGVGVIEPFGEGWSRTVTAGDGLPSPVVTALAFDANGGKLWIGTARGLAVYDPFRGEVTQDPSALGSDPVAEIRAEPVGVVAQSIPSPPGQHMYVRTASGWFRIDTFTFAAEPVSGGRIPPAASEVDVRSLPFLAGGLVRGERSGTRESLRVTGVAALADRRLALGTWGGGVYLYDPVRLAPEPVPFGLAGPGGGPIAWDRIRLWFTNPAGGPVSSALAAEPVAADVSGLSSASADLREWSYAYPGLEPALPSDRVFDAASSGGQTLFATDAGLALYDGTARAWRRLSALTGGAAEVIAVEGAADGFWLGTRAGLVALRQPAAVAGSSADSSTAEETSDASDSLRSAGRWLAGRAVTALVADGRDLYAGTDLGLYRLSPRAPGSTDWTLSQVETVGRSVRDLALTPDVVVAATDRGVEILPRGPGEPVRFLTGESQLDDLPLAVAADAANVWIGTRAGVARWDRTRRLWTEYGLADGLPDLPVLHVLVQDERHVWFSTPGGVTRFDVGDPPRAR
jgi:hypothetical protein